MQKISMKINYCWRVFATGFCFASFGIGGIIIGYVIFPIVMVFTSDTNKKRVRTQYIIHLSFIIFRRLMQHTGLANFYFQGIEKVQEDKGCVLVANHPTLVDYVMIVSKLKQCDNVVKEKLWHNFFVKSVIQAAQYIPNIESSKMFKLLERTKHNQNNLLIFPEGTRTTPGQAIKLQRGAANISIRLNMPIRIIHIKSTESSLSKQSTWYKVPKLKIEYTIKVGEKIYPDTFVKQAGNPSLAARHLTDYLTKSLEKGSHYD
jgi:1-acyl-sn-glycerol-3-phosphate acyltransferase